MRTVRTLFGLLLCAAAIAAGLRAAPPWFYLLLTALFAAASIAGKTYAWRPLPGDPVRPIAAPLATLPVQALVVAVLYGFGYGVGRLIGL